MPVAPTVRVPPVTLIKPCYVAPPPETRLLVNALEYYPQAGSVWEARFLLMSEHWTEQTQELGNCNAQLKGLRQWYDLQQTVEVEQ